MTAYRPERITMPQEIALAIAPPRSKVAKWLRREKRARHIAERQWWPGLHTRWWVEGKERLHKYPSIPVMPGVTT